MTFEISRQFEDHNLGATQSADITPSGRRLMTTMCEFRAAGTVADLIHDTVMAACSCGWVGEPWNDEEEARWQWQDHAEGKFLSSLNSGAVLHRDGSLGAPAHINNVPGQHT